MIKPVIKRANNDKTCDRTVGILSSLVVMTLLFLERVSSLGLKSSGTSLKIAQIF